MNHKGSNSVVCIFAAIPSGGQPGFKNWALFGGKSNKKSKKGFPFETIKRSRMTLLSLCLKKAFLFLFFFFFFFVSVLFLLYMYNCRSVRTLYLTGSGFLFCINE